MTTLYFLEVCASDDLLCKIGVTQRSVDERVAEIAQDVRAVADDVVINVLDAPLWACSAEAAMQRLAVLPLVFTAYTGLCSA